MTRRPIGVFDSGVGGLTVLHELLVQLPAEDFVYQITVANRSANLTATGVSITDLVAPNTGIFVCTDIILNTKGTDSGCSAAGSSSFTWTIGTLLPGEEVFLQFQALALNDGNDVNRAILNADQLSTPVPDEEPTTITP